MWLRSRLFVSERGIANTSVGCLESLQFVYIFFVRITVGTVSSFVLMASDVRPIVFRSKLM